MLLANHKQVARLVAAINEINAVKGPFEASVRRVQRRSRSFLHVSHTDRLAFDYHRVWALTDGHWSSLSTVFAFLPSGVQIRPLLDQHPSLVPQWRKYQGAYDNLHTLLCGINAGSHAYFWPSASRGNSYLRKTEPVGVSMVAAVMAARRVLQGWSLKNACDNSRRIYAQYNRKGSHHGKR